VYNTVLRDASSKTLFIYTVIAFLVFSHSSFAPPAPPRSCAAAVSRVQLVEYKSHGVCVCVCIGIGRIMGWPRGHG